MSNIVYKNFSFSTPFLKGYKELRIPISDKEGKPTWPELFPTEKIEELKNQVGNRHFLSQMMLEYVDAEKARLDPDALHLYEQDFDLRTACIGEEKITSSVIYWDPSSGKRKADGSVCVLIYKDDKNKRIFIHDILYLIVPDNELYPLANQCNQVLDFMRKHNSRRISIETNGIGNALPEIIRQLANKRGEAIVVNPVFNNKRKEIRILDAIEPVLTAGRLYANRKVQYTPFIAEMLGWAPIGSAEHDDGLDAVAGAICDTGTVIRPLGQKVCAFKANTNFKV